jgi:hypothetical protein
MLLYVVVSYDLHLHHLNLLKYNFKTLENLLIFKINTPSQQEEVAPHTISNIFSTLIIHSPATVLMNIPV